MNKTKNFFGFFVAVTMLVMLASSVSAFSEIGENLNVRINDVPLQGNLMSVDAGAPITVQVYFTALATTSDLRLEATIDGDKSSSKVTTVIGNVELGHTYPVTFVIKAPYELKDDVSEDMVLDLVLKNSDYRTRFDDEIGEITLRVQRPAYDASLVSINAADSVNAGELLAVDVTLKNVGYNNLDDVYIVASIPALGLEESAYAGDVVALEDDDNNDYVRARLYLRVPYEAAAGTYSLQVEAGNGDVVVSDTKDVVVNNDFASNLVVTSYSQSFGVGDEGAYTILVVNPTNSLKVYRILVNSPSGLNTRVSEMVVAVPAGLSKTVTVYAKANTQGDYNFDVNVLSGENLVGTATLTANVDSGAGESAVVVLTIVLVIVFLVLLGVLIVLLRKRPEKADEFGESYY